MNFSEMLSMILTALLLWAKTTGVRILLAAFILVFSFKFVNFSLRKLQKKSEEKKYDKTIIRTTVHILRIALKILIVICLIGYVGVDTSGLTALAVSFGAAVGLAINGTLSNLAGGVLLIITRPFKVDDFIEAQGYSGTVEDIHIVTTKLRTPDNKVVYLPNGALSNGNIVNFSEKETRRVDFKFAVSLADDFELAKRLIFDILKSHKMINQAPEPFVRIGEHGSGGVVITARAWVKREDYWTVSFDVTEAVKAAFDKNKIKPPLERIDVRMSGDKE